MEIRIQYQGIDESPWMTKYLEGRLARLERYLSAGAQIHMNLISAGEQCITHLTVITLSHQYKFEKDGCDVFEAFTTTLDEAAMILRREYLKIRGKYHQQFFDLTEP